jgi:beta-galactosidase
MDEHRLLNSSPEYMHQLERLVRRDRNHASVFIWSIGNEEGMIQTNGTGKRIALSLIKALNELDPSRTCTYAADVANVFPGVNEVIPVRGFNYRHQGVEPYHFDHPRQPVIGTEMGSTVTTRGIYEKDTIRCYLPDQDITAPWWASTAEEWWKLCAAQPWWTGSFIWTGFDYRGEPTPFKWPNINSHFGITDMCGFRKNVSWYYQSWWTEEDILHIAPHWNWKGKEGDLIKVWVNSNADEVELKLNGKNLGKKTMERNSHLTWEVPYRPGKLEATGFRNGRKMVTTVETTGEPVNLVLEPDRTAMMTGGRDGCVINVHVTDDRGRLVPDAMNLVTFSLSGPGEIIGVGNGDPSCHESDKCMDGRWQRSLFNGHCQLIIRGLYEPGEIRLEAASAGLQPAELSLGVK